MVTPEPCNGPIDPSNVRVITRGCACIGKYAKQENTQKEERQQWVQREENVKRRDTPLPTFGA